MAAKRAILAYLANFDFEAPKVTQPHQAKPRSPGDALQRGFFSLVFHTDRFSVIVSAAFDLHHFSCRPWISGECYVLLRSFQKVKNDRFGRTELGAGRALGQAVN